MENGVIEFIDWLYDYCFNENIETGDFDCFSALLMYLITEEYGSFREAFEQALADADSREEAYEAIYDEFEVKCSYSNHEFESNVGDYFVFDDYDDAEAEAIDREESLIDDIGIPENYREDEDFVDVDWFNDAMKESYETYCEDIANEGSDRFENRLVEECYENERIDDDDFEETEYGEPDYENCLVDEDELIDRLSDYFCDNYRNGVQWYVDNFGEREFAEVCKHHGLCDSVAFAKFAVDTDGCGSALAGYDGNEIEFQFDDKYYWMYRTN
jgi:hypothetical protein